MTMTTLQDTMLTIGKQARDASRQVAKSSDQTKSNALRFMAEQLLEKKDWLQQENAKDIANAERNGLEPALLDRLRLSDKALGLMAAGLQQIAAMADPVGELTETKKRPNGMQIARMRVPLGVIGIIYESRPNVTIDAAALCLKSGNAAILRGGSEAIHSNTALGQIIQDGLSKAGLPAHAVQVVQTTDRAAVGELVTMTEYVDVIVPRGGKGLIKRLSDEARVPLIKHLDGNCHVYVDRTADLEKALTIAVNAKTYRYGICGTMETLLVDAPVAGSFLPKLAEALAPHQVELRGCTATQAILPSVTAATESDWETEYLAPILAIKVVNDLDEAIAHIEQYGSGHTDSVVTENLGVAQRFQREVDASSVYVNLPTCFADGFEYGLGAEIGISTNKLHARGPVGLEGLTTLKWVLTGNAQTRG